MYVEVTISADALNRTQYRFILLDSHLVFNSYAVEQRLTTKHKWRAREYWSRLRMGSDDGAQLVTKPVLTADIKAKALQELLRTVEVEG
ncbi:MAG TPA: hypothetical protein VIG47_16850 [Gemmatimonadaceae bacterium]|jgi:hypothetical protein